MGAAQGLILGLSRWLSQCPVDPVGVRTAGCGKPACCGWFAIGAVVHVLTTDL